MTIAGLDVLSQRPSFGGGATVMSAARLGQMADFGLARRYTAFPGKDAIHGFAFDYVLRGTEIAALQAFHEARAGRWQAFVVPSWAADLSNGETNTTQFSEGGDPFIYVDWCDYANNYGKQLTDVGRLGAFVFILNPSGFLDVRQVVTVGPSVANNYDKLNLDGGISFDLSPGDGSIIGFCHKVRFGEDDLSLEFQGPLNATCQLAFTQVLTSTPEADVA